MYLAANTLLLQYVTLLAYALDGFAFAIEAACGEALGANKRRRFYRLCNGAAIYSIFVAVAATVGFLVAQRRFYQHAHHPRESARNSQCPCSMGYVGTHY